MSASSEIKTIPGYPDYAITKDGRVWSKPRQDALGHNLKGKWLRLGNRRGYLSVTLIINSRSRTYFVHRLVLETYVGPCPPGMECRHLNNIPQDNCLENLIWGTKSENQQDSIYRGTHVSLRRGSSSIGAKLCEEQVRVIFHAYHDGIHTLKELAQVFLVSLETIYLIVRKKTWGHLWGETI